MTVSKGTIVWAQQLSIAAALAIQGGLALQFSPLATLTFTQACTTIGYRPQYSLT